MVAASNAIAGVVVGRFISGFVSAMPSCVAAGSLEDLWDEHRRIWVLWIWVAMAVIALGLGPVVGAYLSSSDLGWYVVTCKSKSFSDENRPWVFYIAAIVFATITLISLGMHESRTSRVITLNISKALKSHGGW